MNCLEECDQDLAFLESFIEHSAALKIGDPVLQETKLGP